MPKYIVNKPFRSKGRFFNRGDIITSLDEVKLGKIKVNERKLILIPEDEEGRARLAVYFEQRRRVDLEQALADHAASQTEDEELVDDEDLDTGSEPDASDSEEDASEAPDVAEPSAKADSTPTPGTDAPTVTPVAAPAKAETPKTTTPAASAATTVKPVIKPPIKKA
jgi:cell division protein FtsN